VTIDDATFREEFGEPWKRAIRALLPHFLELFLPRLHEIVDWNCQPIFLETELDATSKESPTGRRIADLVVQLRRRDGHDTYLVVLVEIQGQWKADLAEAVFRKFLRLVDRHDSPVEVIVVLTDIHSAWRPERFELRGRTTRIVLEFPVIKILDWRERKAELEATSNPFATFVLAVLTTLETDPDETRQSRKISLIKRMFRQGLRLDLLRELVHAADQVMGLAPSLDRDAWDTIRADKETNAMTYIPIFERDAMERGRLLGLAEGKAEGKVEAVLTVLHTKFVDAPAEWIDQLKQIRDPAVLDSLMRAALDAKSTSDFSAKLRAETNIEQA
jgi:hypothetical protein